MTVKNVGKGRLSRRRRQLRNRSDEGIFINKGRFDVDNLRARRQAKSVDFTYVRPRVPGDNFKLEMSLRHRPARVRHRQAEFPVPPSPAAVQADSGAVTVHQATRPSSARGARRGAPVIGARSKGDVVQG